MNGMHRTQSDYPHLDLLTIVITRVLSFFNVKPAKAQHWSVDAICGLTLMLVLFAARAAFSDYFGISLSSKRTPCLFVCFSLLCFCFFFLPATSHTLVITANLNYCTDGVHSFQNTE